MPKRHAITKRQTAAIHTLMLSHIRTDEAANLAIYDDGWNDARVLAEVKNPEPEKVISIHSVANFRHQVFGPVVRKREPKQLQLVPVEGRAQIDGLIWEVWEGRWKKRFEATAAAINERIDSLEAETHSRQRAMLDAFNERLRVRDVNDSVVLDRINRLEEGLRVYATAEAANRQRIGAIDAYLRTRGYQPPPGRPQSTPREPDPNGQAAS